MTQKQWVNHICQRYGFTKAFSLQLIHDIGQQMAVEVTYQGKTALVGFGTFKRVEYPSRKCVVPTTREKFVAEPKVRVRFKEGYDLKQLLNPAE